MNLKNLVRSSEGFGLLMDKMAFMNLIMIKNSVIIQGTGSLEKVKINQIVS